MTLICIGMLGEYVGRTFLCVNNSPQYVVRETYNVKKDNDLMKTEEEGNRKNGSVDDSGIDG